MPGMDGYDLLRRLRETPGGAGMPVVYVSARVSRDDVRAGMKLGADDYLTKPFDMRELLGAAKTRLRRHDETKALASRAGVEEQGRMLLVLPHELRTPLAGILGCAGLLRDDLAAGVPPSAVMLGLAEDIMASGLRMERLATNLVLHLQLEIAVQSEERSREFASAGPAETVGRTEAVARSVAVEHGRVDCLSSALDDSVAAALSPHVLEKILTEIIDNAFKFSAAGTAVDIAMKSSGERVEWTVSDRGVGVTGEEAAGMGAFRQWRRKKREQQGLGLGFGIARRLAEFNGGALTIDPREGGGSVVCLSLPRAQVC